MNNPDSKYSTDKLSLDKVIEAACIILMIAITIYVITSWFMLPDIVPIHFNARGEADGYGSKVTLLIILPVVYIFYAILSYGQKNPQSNNYIVTITEENKARQYRLLVNLVRVMKLEVIMVFSYLQYAMIQSAYKSFALGIWFLPVTLVLIFGSLIVYLYKSTKAK